jgi:hypothetical protein
LAHGIWYTLDLRFRLEQIRESRPPKVASSLLQPSNLAALHDGIDIALRLRLVDAVLGDDLGNEIVRALECVELLLGELAPPGADILEQNLLNLGRIDGIRGYWVHERYLQNIDETSSECASLKQHSLRGDELRQSQWRGDHCLKYKQGRVGPVPGDRNVRHWAT